MTGRKGEAALDSWSWAHIASGAGLAVVGLKTTWALALLIGFEVLEGGLRRIKTSKHSSGLFEYESWPNIFADIAVGAAGYFVARAAMILTMDQFS